MLSNTVRNGTLALLQTRGYFAQQSTPVGRLQSPISFGLLLGESGWRARQAALYRDLQARTTLLAHCATAA